MMRWSYKTIHYELKKEGLLGSTFLDESAIELSLNQYGKAGWELVSLLETLDGLIAIFKQPLDLDTRFPGFPATRIDRSEEQREATVSKAKIPGGETEEKYDLELVDDVDFGAVVVDEFEVVEDVVGKADERAEGTVAKVGEKQKRPPADVGSIRIE